MEFPRYRISFYHGVWSHLNRRLGMPKDARIREDVYVYRGLQSRQLSLKPGGQIHEHLFRPDTSLPRLRHLCTLGDALGTRFLAA